MSYTRRTRRNDYYLDVSDFVLSDPRQLVPSPRRTPIQQINSNDVTTYYSIEVCKPALQLQCTIFCHLAYFRLSLLTMFHLLLRLREFSFPPTFQWMGQHSTFSFTILLSKYLKKYSLVKHRTNRTNFPTINTHNRIIKIIQDKRKVQSSMKCLWKNKT